MILALRPGDVDLARVCPQDEIVESVVNPIEVEVRDRTNDVLGFTFERAERSAIAREVGGLLVDHFQHL